jgi:tRNA dimethylallyltransferase
MDSKPLLVVLGGPTASGKTTLAIELARELDTEIVSADSRQFYREMSIGTAKPSAGERSLVPHHLVDFLSVTQTYTAGDFERDALQCLQSLFARKPVALLTGGSGLYLRAVYVGMDDFPEVPEELRLRWEQTLASEGLEPLQRALQQLDPEYYQTVDRQNPARLIRALAVCEASGKPYSSFRRQTPEPRPFQHRLLALEWPREELYRRIEQRVDDMMRHGLLEEARSLYPLRHYPALRTVGYQELFEHFEARCSLEEAVEKIKQHTRNYAKRQMTWFRRQGNWQFFHPSDLEGILRFLRD